VIIHRLTSHVTRPIRFAALRLVTASQSHSLRSISMQRCSNNAACSSISTTKTGWTEKHAGPNKKRSPPPPTVCSPTVQNMWDRPYKGKVPKKVLHVRIHFYFCFGTSLIVICHILLDLSIFEFFYRPPCDFHCIIMANICKFPKVNRGWRRIGVN
jgi:hypothetical protein